MEKPPDGTDRVEDSNGSARRHQGRDEIRAERGLARVELQPGDGQEMELSRSFRLHLPEEPERIVEELQLCGGTLLIKVGRLIGLRTRHESAIHVRGQVAPCQRGNVRTIVPPLAEAQIDREAVFPRSQIFERPGLYPAISGQRDPGTILKDELSLGQLEGSLR